MDLFLSILLQIIVSDMHITETVLNAAWILFFLGSNLYADEWIIIFPTLFWSLGLTLSGLPDRVL